MDQLNAVHGIGPVCAQDIIAEIGTTMTAFPTAHLVSWARWSPQVKQSAGRRTGSNATGRGNPYLSAALGEAATAAGRTQSFLGARYRRMVRRMPKKKALVATGNSMLTIIYALLADPAARYTDLGADYHEQRIHPCRQARNHVRSLERLGYKVTIQAINPDTSESPAPPPEPPPRSTLSPAARGAPPGAAACPPQVRLSDQTKTETTVVELQATGSCMRGD